MADKNKNNYLWIGIAVVAVVVLAIVFISNSNDNSQSEVICNSPYIKVGTSCCLDQNNNGICDNDEQNGNIELSINNIVLYNGLDALNIINPQCSWQDSSVKCSGKVKINENVETTSPDGTTLRLNCLYPEGGYYPSYDEKKFFDFDKDKTYDFSLTCFIDQKRDVIAELQVSGVFYPSN